MKPLDEAMRRAQGAVMSLMLGGGRAGCSEIVDTVIASLAADGFVLVPREATREMVESDSASDPDSNRGFLSSETLAHVWRCMLAAAPKPGEPV